MKNFCENFTVSSLSASTVTEINAILRVSSGDSVIVATSVHVQLSKDSQSHLSEKLKEWFPHNSIVINSVLTHDPTLQAKVLESQLQGKGSH